MATAAQGFSCTYASAAFAAEKPVAPPSPKPVLEDRILEALQWRAIGPFRGGRVNAVSGVAGTVTPLVLKRLGADPATASTIFLTTATDVVSMGMFLWLANVLVLSAIAPFTSALLGRVVLGAGGNPHLPHVEILEERTVGPSLGKDSISSGIKASLYGILAVAVFMLIYYMFAGMVANIALMPLLVVLAGLAVFFVRRRRQNPA